MRFKIFFAIFLTLFTAVLSAEQLYKVEIIVFAHVTPAALNSEHWPTDPRLPAMSRVRDLLPMAITTADDTAQVQPSNYQILIPTDLDMSSIVKKLKAAKDYPPLIHVAWLQPGMPVKNSPRIHLYGGQAYDASDNPLDVVSPLTESEPQNNTDNNATANPDANVNLTTSTNLQSVASWQLNGYVRVSQPYLFQIDTDLVLTIPRQQLVKMVPSIADDIKSTHFVMDQTFRMKLGELYYIDHPLFGVLVEVNKYPQPTSK
jgi:hypothetical protein